MKFEARQRLISAILAINAHVGWAAAVIPAKKSSN